MPVSLERRIRRIGLFLSTKDEKGNRVHNYDPNYLEPGSKALIIAELRKTYKLNRAAAFAKQSAAEARHKAAVKARRKAKSTPAPAVVVSSTPAKGAK